MARILTVTPRAELDIQEIVLQRAQFDLGSALKYYERILDKARLILPHPKLHALSFERDGIEYREFYVQSTTIVYTIDNDELAIVRVFGPGRDWQDEV